MIVRSMKRSVHTCKKMYLYFHRSLLYLIYENMFLNPKTSKTKFMIN